MPHSKNDTPNKLLGLEIIRFLSAMAVLVFHYGHFAQVGVVGHPELIKENAPFYGFLSLFYNYGGYAVQIFWSLSGFIFFWKYKEAIQNNVISVKQFFVNRFSRLYPLHLLTLLCVAMLQYVYFKGHHSYFVYSNNSFLAFILHFFFASAWGMSPGQSFNGPIWSVSIEVMVYTLFFVTTRFFKKNLHRGIILAGFVLLLKLAHLKTHLVLCLAYFYLGGITAEIQKKIETSSYKTVFNLGIIIGLLVLGSLYIFFALYSFFVFKTLAIMTMSSILIYFVSRPFRCHPALEKAIEVAGNMTYSSYLIHFPLQLGVVVMSSQFKWTIPVYSPTFFLAYLGISLAIPVYRGIEWPLQKWIRKKLLE